MQVSTRLSYPEPGYGRSRPLAPRPWTGDPVPAIRPDERGGGHRGTLARGSQQQVNDRFAGGSADKQVFVARSLTSTLAMLQMSVVPEEATPSEEPAALPSSQAAAYAAVVDDLFSDVFSPKTSQ